MVAKVALFFLLDTSKAKVPQGSGMQLSPEKVAPLYDSLAKECRFTKLTFPDSTVLCISLFKKPFATDMVVLIRDLGNHTKSQVVNSSRQQLAKVLGASPDSFYLADYQYRALWLGKGVQRQEFVHLLETFSGERAVDPDELPRFEARDYWVMNHEEGFIFGGKNEQDFNRALVFFALAQAYHFQFSQQINRLSAASEQAVETLLGLRMEALRFRAHYFFGNPVKPGGRDAFATYAHLIRSLDLVPVEQELARKINDIGNLIQMKQASAQLGGATESVWPDPFRTQPNKPGPKDVAPLPDKVTVKRKPRRVGLWLLLVLVAAGIVGVVALDEARNIVLPLIERLLGSGGFDG